MQRWVLGLAMLGAPAGGAGAQESWTYACPPDGLTVLTAVIANPNTRGSRSYHGADRADPTLCLIQEGGGAIVSAAYHLHTPGATGAAEAIAALRRLVPARPGAEVYYERYDRATGGGAGPLRRWTYRFVGFVQYRTPAGTFDAAELVLREEAVNGSYAGETTYYFDRRTGIMLGRGYRLIRGQPAARPDWHVTEIRRR